MQTEDLTPEDKKSASGEATKGMETSPLTTPIESPLQEEQESSESDAPRKRSRVRMKVSGSGAQRAFALKKNFDETNTVRVAVSKERGDMSADDQRMNDFELFVQQNNHLVPRVNANTSKEKEIEEKEEEESSSREGTPIVMSRLELEKPVDQKRPIVAKGLGLYSSDLVEELPPATPNALISRHNRAERDGTDFIISRPRANRDSRERYRTSVNREVAKKPSTNSPDGSKRHADKPAVAGRFSESPERAPRDKDINLHARGESHSPKGSSRPSQKERAVSSRATGTFSKEGQERSARGRSAQGDQRNKKHTPYVPTIQPAADFIPSYPEENEGSSAPIRLNKFLANAGICSRRSADDLIAAGKIKVNGEVITKMGTEITRQDAVEYNGKIISIERKVYVLLNKPKNCVTTADDPDGRITVLDLAKNACKERIFPVGRLDRNTTGVLLLTNDGDLMAKLLHPSFLKKKIYQVTLDKPVSVEHMQLIAEGIELEDGLIHADAVSYVDEEDFSIVGIEIHSGRNRIVRRIFEHFGYKIKKLDRVYFAGLTKKNISRGRWRYLSEEEVNRLRMGNYE